MVNYLSGNIIEGSSTLTTTPPNTSWKELGRATLSSDGDSIDVGSITAKDNIMLLSYVHEDSGSLHPSLRFNNDSNTNYVHRSQTNGNADWTSHTQNKLRYGAGTSNTWQFNVAQIANVADREKLMTSQMAYTQDGTLYREETVGKWANTSSQINDVELINSQSGDFDSGSEVVVLGCDNDEADSGTNFWQELASVELSSANNEIDSGTFTAKKYLWLEIFTTGVSVSTHPNIEFNSDNGANYSSRHWDYGDNETTQSGANCSPYYNRSNVHASDYLSAYIVNISNRQKLMTGHVVQRDPTGANNAPERHEFVFKWTNTSSQITSIQFDWGTGSDTFSAGSKMKIWGAD